jgi:DHA1 family bicyclomycin/chloramphenicol resistance-like MFS transporter
MSVPFWALLLLAGPGQVATGAVLPALPAIAAGFGVELRAVQWGVTAYIAAFALGQLPAGWATDRFGRRATALGGAGLFTLAAGLSMLAPGLSALIGLRALEGVGAGVLLVAQRAAMRDRERGEALARSLALVSSAVWVLGGVSGLVAGVLVQVSGWRAAMGMTGAFGLATIVAATWLPARQLAAPAPGAGPGADSASYTQSPVFWRHSLVGALMVGALYAFLTGAPAILARLGIAPGWLGVLQLAAVAVFTLSALAARRAGAPSWPGFVLGAAAPFALLLPGFIGICLCLALLAGAAGLVIPPALAAAVDPFPEQAGAASGGTNLLQTLGAAAASALVSLPGDPGLVIPGTMLALVLGAAASHALLARQPVSRASSRRAATVSGKHNAK